MAFVVQPAGSNRWTVRPGCRILVLGRGAVRFDFPQDWQVDIYEKYVRLVDRTPPDDRCGLMISYRMISTRVAVYPITELLKQITDDDSGERTILERGQIMNSHRFPLEVAWRQLRFLDSLQQRDAYTR